MSRPWMPLYIADYRADTARLCAAQHGAYLLLIMEYWRSGNLPDNDAQLAQIACMTAAEWRKTRPLIEPYFQAGWKHKRIDKELAHADEVSSKRRASANQRHSKRDANADANANANANANAHTSHSSQSTSLRSVSSDPPSSDATFFSEESKKEENVAPASRQDFEQFWQVYPHKVGKKAAYKAFVNAKKSGATLEIIMPALARYVSKTDDRPWCNPATWLNEGRWEDQPAAGNGTLQNRSGKSDLNEAFAEIRSRMGAGPGGAANGQLSQGRLQRPQGVHSDAGGDSRAVPAGDRGVRDGPTDGPPEATEVPFAAVRRG